MDFPKEMITKNSGGFDRIEIKYTESKRCISICPHGQYLVPDGASNKIPIKVGSLRCIGCNHFVRKEDGADGKKYVVCSFTGDMIDRELDRSKEK